MISVYFAISFINSIFLNKVNIYNFISQKILQIGGLSKRNSFLKFLEVFIQGSRQVDIEDLYWEFS